MSDTADPLAALLRDGALHAAINTGNRALVQTGPDGLSGVSPMLAKRLAERLGAPLVPVMYEGAGPVFADAESGRWQVAFLARDPIRAAKVSFTRPYHVIEATYAVRADAPDTTPEALDRDGVTILTSTGSAYDLYLQKALRHATLEHSGTPTESFAEFADGRADAVAGVRASLERFFDNQADIRILAEPLTKVEQTMVLPGADAPLIEALDAFVAEAIESGAVARALAG